MIGIKKRDEKEKMRRRKRNKFGCTFNAPSVGENFEVIFVRSFENKDQKRSL
jgi:hypothetical protein